MAAPAAAAAPAGGAAGRVCRYCFDEEEEGAELVAPCDCKGGSQWCHVECLRRWQRSVLIEQPTHPLYYADDQRQSVCQVCAKEFSIPPLSRAELMRSFSGPELAALVRPGCLIVSTPHSSATSERLVQAVPHMRESLVHWIRGVFITLRSADGSDDGGITAVNLTRPIPAPTATMRLTAEKIKSIAPMVSRVEHHIGGPCEPSFPHCIAYLGDDPREELLVAASQLLLAAAAAAAAAATPAAAAASAARAAAVRAAAAAAAPAAALALGAVAPAVPGTSGSREDGDERSEGSDEGGGMSRLMQQLLAAAPRLGSEECERRYEEMMAEADRPWGWDLSTEQINELFDDFDERGMGEDSSDDAGSTECFLMPGAMLINRVRPIGRQGGLWVSGGPKEVARAVARHYEAYPDRAVPRVKVCWGYAGWSRTQLLGELAKGSWGMCPASAADCFAEDLDTTAAAPPQPTELWQKIVGSGRLIYAPDNEMQQDYSRRLAEMAGRIAVHRGGNPGQPAAAAGEPPLRRALEKVSAERLRRQLRDQSAATGAETQSQRLQREARMLADDPPQYVTVAAPAPQSKAQPGDKRKREEGQGDPAPAAAVAPAEWHFVLKGPEGTPYEGGVYHGILRIPSAYPAESPEVVMLSETGRFATGQPIPLTAPPMGADWRPSCTLGTVLAGVTSAWLAGGATELDDDEKRRIAAESAAACRARPGFPVELLSGAEA
eukprot:TRINITY_DN55495_c0_g1_i1.p1 TRINITY_DN55495_c0_g1~~TRINITY_DN55495_c0_g1_i1.p1  ORF type:complete len:721 (+),score=187.74 TRINITY_DN55495_c0_g1_i1:78-2240(+)